MKRKERLFLSLSLVAGMALSACGGATQEAKDSASQAQMETKAEEAGKTEETTNGTGTVDNPEEVTVPAGTLSFWSLFTGGDGDWFKQIKDQYNQTNPKNPVEIITLVWDDYYTKLQTAVAAGKGPDIGISHVSKLYELSQSGVAEPLDDYLKKLNIDLSKDYQNSSLDSVSIDGKIYAIPLDTHAEVMYYNTSLLEEAGVTEEELLNVKDMEGFKDILKRCKEKLPAEISPLGLTQSGDDPFRTWYAIYFQMGGKDFINAEGKNTIDVEVGKKALEELEVLYKEGYILPGIDDSQALFQSGKAAILFGGTWLTGAYEQTENLKFNNTNFPQLFGDKPYCWADSHTLILPKKEKRTEEETLSAVQFMVYASKDGGIVWAGSGQIPSANEANQSEEYKKLKGYNVISELEYAKYAPKSEHYYGGMKKDLMDAVGAYLTGNSSLDEAGAALQEAVENNLD